METIALYIVAATLGSMVFFAAGIAPTVFQSLPEAEAGQFLRRLFPRYYLALILGAGAAGLCFVMTSPLAAAVCLIIAGSTAWVRQVLVPRINQLRDAELGGAPVCSATSMVGWYQYGSIAGTSHPPHQALKR